MIVANIIISYIYINLRAVHNFLSSEVTQNSSFFRPQTFLSSAMTRNFPASGATETFLTSALTKTFLTLAGIQTFLSSAGTQTFLTSAGTQTILTLGTQTFLTSAGTQTFLTSAGGGGGAQEWQSSFQEWSYLGADMMMLKMCLICASLHTRMNVEQTMLSTLLDISFSNILNSQKHMHECPLLSLAQHLTPFSPMSYWRKWKQWKPTLLSLNGTILFWLADQVLFPVSDHKHRCSPRIRQFSITLHTLHKWFRDDSAILS